MSNIQTYKLLIIDKSYSTFKLLHTVTNNDSDPVLLQHINPLEDKLFSKDIISFDLQNPQLPYTNIYSHVKSGTIIAGTLVLENNKTFGRTANKKRLLYKCIPDDKHLPVFLIPYDINIGFSKTYTNKYVVFKYESWINQHPQGVLVDTLGDVNDPIVFYEYQLYCKSLHISLKDITTKTKDEIQKKSKIESVAHNQFINQILENPDFSIEDRRTTHRVFTIDPKKSVDFDDGFSISEEPTDNPNQPIIKISVYIANVFFWLETLNLWKSFSSRVATIYLPDRKRPMLPTILSDHLCSLQEGETRFAFTMDLIWKKKNSGNEDNKEKPYELIDIQFKNTAINVFKNYRYEEPDLLYRSPEYERLFKITSAIDKSVKDSHDLVSHWMTCMNQKCGEYLSEKKIGIFRSAVYKNRLLYDSLLNDPSLNELSREGQQVIMNWNNTAGQYVVYNDGFLEHEVMKTKSYVHITSPIRRLVDLLNMLWFSREIGLLKSTSIESNEFLFSWLSKIDYINDSMRAIRKIQTDCDLIHRCHMSPHILDFVYDGIIFGKLVKNDGSIMYMVYLDSIGILSRMTIHIDLPNYSRGQFKIFMFEDEDRMKKKIRLHMVV